MNGRGPGRAAVAASVALHVVLLGAIVVSAQARPEIPPGRVYRLKIVSPPPQAPGPSTPAVVAAAQPKPEPESPKIEAPEPKLPEVKAKPVPAPPKPKEQPKPKKTEPTPAPEKPKETAAAPEQKEPTPSRGANPDARSPGGDNLNVDLEGEAFAYPEYLENIVRQVRRYFRWDGAPDLEAWVYFVIHRDGAVTDIRIVRKSGNPGFDLQVMGAVEVAGKRGAFGALPEGFEGDRLPVSFHITAT